MIDPHRILSIDRGATADQVRAARNRLARLFHPDRNDSEAATEMMRIVNLAYDTLVFGGPRSERYEAPPPPSQNVDAFASEHFDCEACDFTLTFGKHSGQALGVVARGDWKYLTWIAKNFDPDGWQAEVVEHTRTALQHWSGAVHEEQRRAGQQYRADNR